MLEKRRRPAARRRRFADRDVCGDGRRSLPATFAGDRAKRHNEHEGQNESSTGRLLAPLGMTEANGSRGDMWGDGLESKLCRARSSDLRWHGGSSKAAKTFTYNDASR